MNIDYANALQELKSIADIWCDPPAPGDSTAGAGGYVTAADTALRSGVRAVAIPAHAVHVMWSWLENKGIDVLAIVDGPDSREQPAADGMRIFAERLSEQIQSILKKGADGVILAARYAGAMGRKNQKCRAPELSGLVSALLPVRNDLFFGKKLFVALDMDCIDVLDWAGIFHQLKQIRADGVLFDMRVASNKAKGKGVAGKVYGMLDNWDSDFAGQVMFLSDNPPDMENAWRLVGKMRPAVLNKLRFFIGHK